MPQMKPAPRTPYHAASLASAVNAAGYGIGGFQDAASTSEKNMRRDIGWLFVAFIPVSLAVATLVLLGTTL